MDGKMRVSNYQFKKETRMFTVTTSYLGDKWRWKVEGILELFRLLDKLQRVFAPAEIKVETI